MIDEKKIEEAAEAYSNALQVLSFAYRDFKEGARWMQQEFVNSLWHDVNEKPMTGRLIFALSKYKKVVYNFEFRKEDDWGKRFSNYEIVRWAYIDDVLPKEVRNERLQG